MNRRRWPLTTLGLIAVTSVCGCAEDSATLPDTTVSEPPDTSTDGGPPGSALSLLLQSCPPWTVLDVSSETCHPVGLRDCPPEWVDDAGRCTLPHRCEDGSVPTPTGCIAPGLPDCPEGFRTPHGCRPTANSCERTERIDTTEGCVPVGPRDCHALFRDDDGLCRPDPSLCGPDAVAVYAEGCVNLVDEACATRYPAGLTLAPGERLVDPAAPPGGDGTIDSPYASLTAALDAVDAIGGTARVVLAPGTHQAGIKITQAVELRAACPGTSTISGSAETIAGSPAAALWVRSPGSLKARGLRFDTAAAGVYASKGVDVELRECRFVNSSPAAVWAQSPGTDVSIERCSFAPGDGAPLFGGDSIIAAAGVIAVEAARVSVIDSTVESPLALGLATFSDNTHLAVRRVAVRDLRAIEVDAGFGVLVDSDTTVEIHDSWFFDGPAASVLSQGGSVLVSGSLIESSSQAMAGDPKSFSSLDQAGVVAAAGSSVHIVDSVLASLGESAVYVDGTNAHLQLEGSLIVDSGVPPEISQGEPVGAEAAVVVASGASAVVSDTTIRDSAGFGLLAQGQTVSLTRSVVGWTRAGTDDPLNTAGVAVVSGDFEASESLVVDNARNGVVGLNNASVTLSDCNVSGTVPPNPADGFQDGGETQDLITYGAGVLLGAQLTVTSTRLDDNAGGGVVALGEGTRVSVQQSLVSRSRPAPTAAGMRGGYGIALEDCDEGIIEHSAIEDSTTLALNVFGDGGGLITCRDTAIRRISALGTFGRGIEVQGMQAFIDNTLIEDFATEGLVATRSDTDVEVHQSVIRSAESALSEAGTGMGLAALVSSRVSVTDSVIEGSARNGVSCWSNATFEAQRLCIAHTVAKTPFGESSEGAEPIGDGLSAADGCQLGVENLRVLGNARAGIVADSASGTLQGAQVDSNPFGVVFQGTPQPELGSDGIFVGNDEDLITEGSLEVAPPPEAVQF